MALKQDLKSAFEDNLDNGGEIADIAKLITDVYKDAVNAGTDSIGNRISGVNYQVIEKAIVAQFNLSFRTKSYLQFSLIETALVTAWTSARLKLPATPAPGMSVVASNQVVSSTPPGTTPLTSDTNSYDPIVNKFFSMFSKHAKSVTNNYIGTSTSTPPAPITVPVSGFTIK